MLDVAWTLMHVDARCNVLSPLCSKLHHRWLHHRNRCNYITVSFQTKLVYYCKSINLQQEAPKESIVNFILVLKNLCTSWHTVVMSTMMMVSLLSLLLLLMVPLASADPSGTKCPPAQGRSETCVCQAKEGIIDMTPLSNTNGTARCSQVILNCSC